MMTGQILGGQAPLDAAKYQLMIIWFIFAAALTSSGIVLVLMSRVMIDNRNVGRYPHRHFERDPDAHSSPTRNEARATPISLPLSEGKQQATVFMLTRSQF